MDLISWNINAYLVGYLIFICFIHLPFITYQLKHIIQMSTPKITFGTSGNTFATTPNNTYTYTNTKYKYFYYSANIPASNLVNYGYTTSTLPTNNYNYNTVNTVNSQPYAINTTTNPAFTSNLVSNQAYTTNVASNNYGYGYVAPTTTANYNTVNTTYQPITTAPTNVSTVHNVISNQTINEEIPRPQYSKLYNNGG